ncbi:MAG: hypothetical protein JWO65_812 [Sphingomonas bacterium]|jgi:hypothetical protein|nr:hypothetical protein [Sphingomonas bacterium]
MLDRYFTAHPDSVGESYGEHLVTAGGFGMAMLFGGIACLVHALVPGLCERTGSRMIARLHDRMIANRTSRAAD